MLMSGAAFADSIEDAFKNGTVSGEIRLGYVNQDNDDATTNQNSAAGGHIMYETAAFNGISAGVGFYTTHRIESKAGDGAGTGLFDSNDDSYSILGQAYVNVAMGNTNLKAGRQQIDTPYADSDDIRMIPNLFEAYVLSNTDLPDTTLIAAQVEKWSGVDAGTPEKFEPLVAGADGVTMFAGVYGGIPDTELSLWYYDVDQLTAIAYLEGATEVALGEGMGLALGAQYANQSEKSSSGVDGTVWGISAELGIESAGTTVMAAYNDISNDAGTSVVNGFGGGPYMTSMDETTIEGLYDGSAWLAGVSVDLGMIGAEGLSIGYAYGDFEDGNTGAAKEEYTESDITAEYAINDNLSALVIYTDMEHKTGGVKQSDSFDRLQAYVNYSF